MQEQAQKQNVTSRKSSKSRKRELWSKATSMLMNLSVQKQADQTLAVQVPRSGLHATKYIEWAFSAMDLSEPYSSCPLFDDVSMVYCNHCWLSVLLTHFKFMQSCKEMHYKHSQKFFCGEVFLSLDQWFPARGISTPGFCYVERIWKIHQHILCLREKRKYTLQIGLMLLSILYIHNYFRATAQIKFWKLHKNSLTLKCVCSC